MSSSGSASLTRTPLAPAQRLVDVLVGLERGQDDDLGPAEAVIGRDQPGRGEAVGARHPDVHQDDGRALGPGQRDRLLAVDRLAHYLDVVRRLEQHPEAGPDQRLVVGQQHPDHRGPARPDSAGRPASAGSAPRPRLSSGSRAVTRKPPSGRGPASTVPPAAAARSRMPRNPCPGPVPGARSSAGAAAPRPASAGDAAG
jgi:hypothetical protein